MKNATLYQRAVASEEAERLLADELIAKAEEMALVDRVASIITSSVRIEEVYFNFSNALKDLIDFDRIVVNIVDLDAGTYIAALAAGTHVEGREENTQLALQGTLTEMVIQSGKTIIQEEMEAESLRTDRLIRAGLRSSISMPLVSNGRAIGTMHVQSKQPGAFGAREQTILERPVRADHPGYK